MRSISREEARLRLDFVKGQKYTLHDLRAEISASHFATAHRLVHTLKGIAGLIGEENLASVAIKVEQQLKHKRHPDEGDMTALEDELNRVLNEITDSGIDEETLHTPPTIDEQAALFDKLHGLLADSDAACTGLVSELSLIPETKVLVRQIENYAFGQALVTLEVLREVLGL